MAHALTAVRLLLVLPTTVAFARPEFLDPRILFVLLWAAIATDYGDGKVARMTGTASARGQLFDHGTDFVFVTAGLTGAAIAGLVTPILPVLITIAFSQHVLDSYRKDRQKQLRMSAIGRWTGILYFVPLVLISASRLASPAGVASMLTLTAGTACYALALLSSSAALDHRLPSHCEQLR